MDILQQIQNDLLDENAALSNTLRKAKVLASQLGSDDLAKWVSFELNGYDSKDDLPDYRIIKTRCFGIWTNGGWTVNNNLVPISQIKDEQLLEHLTTYYALKGIHAIEEHAKSEEVIVALSPETVSLVNYYVSTNGYQYVYIKYTLSPTDFGQILDTVKNRLLDFILQLDNKWVTRDKPPAQDELNRLVEIHIHNIPQGGNTMTVFDQRGQHVNYQYNAAGNINFDTVHNKEDLVRELDKFRLEIEKAKESKVINQDIAVEAEYHVLQATKEATKEHPDKQSFLDYIGKAKALFDDLTAATYFVAALINVAEIARRILT
jgi:hypothetical protein